MMPLRRSTPCLLTALTLSLPMTGCTTVAKQAFHEVRGAHSDVLLITDLNEQTLRPYQRVTFDPVISTLGDKLCPPELREVFNQNLAEQGATLQTAYSGGGPGLRVGSEILFFQEKGLLSQAELLSRVRMHDMNTSQLVLDAVVRTESKAFRAGGKTALARSNAEAIGKLLRRRGMEATEDEDEPEEVEAREAD